MIGRRWSAPILVAVLLAAGSLLTSSPGPVAGSDGPCPGTTGVTVVVDYHALGGGVVVRCAPGSPTSGFKALQAAGFAYEQVSSMRGFLCRIDGKPTAEQGGDCSRTPPPSAYWTYWHADRGGDWIYSPWGADHKPEVGSVEGWAFQTGGGALSPPGIAPPAEPATPKPTAKPTPRPTAKPTATAVPTPAPTPKPTAGAATPRPTAQPTPVPSPTASDVAVATSSSTSSPGATLPPSAASPIATDPGSTPAAIPTASASPPPVGAAPTTASGGGGPPLGTLLGLGLVAAIAILGWSRRPSRRGGDG